LAFSAWSFSLWAYVAAAGAEAIIERLTEERGHCYRFEEKAGVEGTVNMPAVEGRAAGGEEKQWPMAATTDDFW
jgi:hypothetical protein